MATSLYDVSVASYLQALGGVAGILAKGKESAAAGDLDLDKLVDSNYGTICCPSASR